MQSVSSRIWTRVAVSNSYDDNHYTTGTSIIAWLEFELAYYDFAVQLLSHYDRPKFSFSFSSTGCHTKVKGSNLLYYLLIHFWAFLYLPGLLAGPSGIRVGWGIEMHGRFEAERPPTSVGPPSGGRAAFLTPKHHLYSTRPWGLVQAIFWHTCPDLDLGPGHCLTHMTHIALSGSMTSLVRVSDRPRPSSLPFIPTFIGLRAFDLVSSSVWWEATTNIIPFSALFAQWEMRTALSRIWTRVAEFSSYNDNWRLRLDSCILNYCCLVMIIFILFFCFFFYKNNLCWDSLHYYYYFITSFAHYYRNSWWQLSVLTNKAQTAGTIEYTDCISSEG